MLGDPCSRWIDIVNEKNEIIDKARELIMRLDREINYGQSADYSLCRFCGGDICLAIHSNTCLKYAVNKFLNESSILEA